MNSQVRQKRPLRRPSRAVRLWGLYLLALAAWAAAVAAAALVGALVCAAFVWQDTPLYRFLLLVREYILLVNAAVTLLGWVWISYFFITRPVRQLETLAAAAEQLARPGEEPISLPPALAETEARLNAVRERALRDAWTAREAEQRKNDLVVYLAHDLKTPLTSVIGYLTLLRDEPQLSSQLRARYTGVALEKAERLEELVNEFFDIARFNLSHLELQRQPTDLTRLLEQVASEFQPILAQAHLTCQLDLPPRLMCGGDPEKLSRVFDNLLRNACHYSFPDTAVRIAGREEGAWAVLTFSNAGRTIPPEQLQRIFQQFFRLDAARATASGGAGLGLAIAREIVELHGGTIAAQSADQQITFTVTLPLGEAP